MSKTRVGVFAAALASAFALTACAANPGVDKASAAKANANLGADFLRKNETDTAQTYFQKALNYDDEDFSANWGMAVVNDRLGNPGAARKYYEKTLNLRASPAVSNSYGAFLCRHGEVDPAVAQFKRAAADPHYHSKADALANAGLCLARAERLAAAAGYYRRALAVDGAQGLALAHMARIEYRRGRYLKARAFVERADAATDLDAAQLLLGAKIELALNDRTAAKSYLKRHNASRPDAAVSLSQLEQPRS